MKELLYFLSNHHNQSFKVFLEKPDLVKIDQKKEIRLSRQLTEEELADWCQYQSGRKGIRFPTVIVMGKCPV